jgi:hypothetical protein
VRTRLINVHTALLHETSGSLAAYGITAGKCACPFASPYIIALMSAIVVRAARLESSNRRSGHHEYTGGKGRAADGFGLLCDSSFKNPRCKRL